MSNAKPLGHRAYGSIGHLPGSRTGPADHTVEENQAKIILEGKAGFTITASEKLDGSCMAVARIGDDIVPLGRAGYRAGSSPYEHLRQFEAWVLARYGAFMDLLKPGQRVVGEWMNKRISIPYAILNEDGMFNGFDLMTEHTRAPLAEWSAFASEARHTMGIVDRYEVSLDLTPTPESWLSWYRGITRLMVPIVPMEEPEGVVYRVERKGKGVVFLAKWVRADHVPGALLDADVYNQVGMPCA